MKTLYFVLPVLFASHEVVAQKTAETLLATNITAHCATLNGKIIGAQTNTKLTFFVGESLQQPMHPTAWITATTTGDSLWSYDLCNLKCNTVYYVEFCSVGTSEFPCGNPLSFKTQDTAGCTTYISASSKKSLDVYPNPVVTMLHINTAGRGIYTLYSAIGAKVLSAIVIGETVLDVHSLSAGIYYLQVQQETRQAVYKILKL